MHIVLIGYFFVIAMLAVTSDTLLHGGLVLLFLGALPCWFLIWRMRRKQLKRMQKQQRAG